MAKRILFIAPYPHDRAPSQRFRFEQYMSWLKEQGYEVELVPFLNENGWNSLYKEGSTMSKAAAMFGGFARRKMLMFRIRRFDYIFIHREASMIGPPVFEWFIAKVLRRKFIYDFDDAIWLPNYSESNARFQKIKMYGKVRKIMKWSDRITAGNNFLADFARQYNSNVQVLPTTIDTEHMHNRKGNPDNPVPLIGWTGTHTTAKYIETLLPVLDKLYEDHDFLFRIISNQPPDFERPYIDFERWKKEQEIEDLASFNIGVMPLTDSEWTKGKCGFKGLQYMALEIPAVMSPVGTNKVIVEHGKNGLLCDTDDEWYNALKELLDDPALREQLGKAGRETVIDQYSVLSQRENYLKLFS